MTRYTPPFTLDYAMLGKVAEIAERLGRWRQASRDALQPQLRRNHRIRSVQASLAIEQNTLTLEQVTAVLDGRPVLGLPREIQEVKNAFAAYDALPTWDPTRLDDLCAAHGLLMRGLADDAGGLRQGGVGIYRGERLLHMAPPANQLPRLLGDLLGWLAQTEAHPLIASSAVHYELEFIHPFSDGNGRIGRLWQTLILSRWQPMLAYLPVETVIQRRQDDYYSALGEADRASDCSGFIRFMLEAIDDALQQALEAGGMGGVAEALVKTPVKTLVKGRINSGDALLAVLAAHPGATLAEAAAHLGKSVSAIERAARRLREDGRLRYVGPQKGGHWEVME
ncbi:MAG TPA: Fic family protein [Xanthomonadaceae bacterium]